MTCKGLEKRQAMENVKFEAAKAIRKILDDARKQYGAQAYDDEEAEAAILELVTQEDE